MVNKFIASQLGNPSGLFGGLVLAVMNRQNGALYGKTAGMLALNDGEAVLDIGCGNGYVLGMLAREHDCEFMGIDISADIIKTATRRLREFVKSGKVRLQVQNVEALAFADNSFDKIYTINTIYFWENLDRAMSEIWRVLKPGGLFVNAFYSAKTLANFPHTQYGYRHFSHDQLVMAGQNAGFAKHDIKIVPILKGAAYCALYSKAV
jgi:ubiquinone/menaquinone biosynthesis C-methylase UbiE